MIVSINHKVFSLRDIQLWPDREVEMLSNNDPLDLCADRFCALLPCDKGRPPAVSLHNGRETDWVH